MPSSYSTDLRIELIATGEQSGTWGSTTNTNLGTVIEDAIAGMASVTTIVSPYTLTTVNGAADEARCAALQLSTTTGANFIVIVPTVTKLYVVKNVDLTYSVEVKTASGTGVIIPAGKTSLVRCDGVNVVQQLDYLSSLTLGNVLTVPSGGTGLSSATAYSVLCGGTTSTGAFQSVSGLGSASQVLTSNGAGALPTWQSLPSTPPPFASGTALLFAQTSAPTGWTKITSYNDAALRIVSGTASSGGSVNFTTAFSNTITGAATLSTSQMPSHTHGVRYNAGNGSFSGLQVTAINTTVNDTNFPSGATGGGGSHDHPINLAVKYVDAIIATKD